MSASDYRPNPRARSKWCSVSSKRGLHLGCAASINFLTLPRASSLEKVSRTSFWFKWIRMDFPDLAGVCPVTLEADRVQHPSPHHQYSSNPVESRKSLKTSILQTHHGMWVLLSPGVHSHDVLQVGVPSQRIELCSPAYKDGASPQCFKGKRVDMEDQLSWSLLRTRISTEFWSLTESILILSLRIKKSFLGSRYTP